MGISSSKILSAYQIDGNDIGYCIEFGNAAGAEKWRKFSGLSGNGKIVYISTDREPLLKDIGVLEQIEFGNYKKHDIVEEAKQKIINQLKITENTKSNHELAKIYVAKHKILGVPIPFEFELLENDDVRLNSLNIPRELDEIVIPPFITSYKITESKVHEILSSPFSFLRLKSIIIQNRPGVPLNMYGVFSGIMSRHLTVKFEHPECVWNMYGAFSECDVLTSITLDGFTGKNLAIATDLFACCYCLETVNMPDFKPDNLVDANCAFIQCSSLNKINIPNGVIKNILFKEDIFYSAGKYDAKF